MRFDKHILSITLLVAALVYSLWFVFAGFGNHQDPLYWLFKYEHLEGGWMAAGTILTGGTIVRILGAALLPLRIAGWLCVVGAIALPYCCLLNKEQRRDNLHWLGLTYVLMGYGAFQEFSPGTLTVLLLSAIWVCATKFKISNIKYKIFTALLAGLAVSVRFPNILVLLVLIPLWRKRSLWAVPLAAVSAGMIYLLGYWLLTPAPLDAAMSSHDLLPMISKLWENGGRLVGYALLGIGVVAIGKKAFENCHWSLVIWKGIAVGLALVYFIYSTIKPYQWYHMDLMYLISALVLVIAITSNPLTSNPLIYGAAILSVATLGTDTAWLKLFPAVLCLLPVAAVQYEKKERTYLWIVLAIVSIMVAVRMTNCSVGQSRLTNATTFSSIAPYKGIAIREMEEQRLMQYKTDFDSLTTSNPLTSNPLILSIGQENHLMRAVTGCEAAWFNEFWSNIYDSVYTAKYRDIIVTERPIVFCSFSPQFKTQPTYQDTQSRFENMLREEGYTVIDRSKYKYMIYVPEIQ